jgi:DNA-binding response OmpR family regulator
LESVFNTVDTKGFDLIILDTHLKDISGIEVARKIKQRLPDQWIIITSTTASVSEMGSFGLSKDDILQKPFSFSKLLGLVKPKK